MLWKVVGCCLAIASGASVCHAQDAAGFVDQVQIISPQISPGGGQVALIRQTANDQQLVVIHVSAGALSRAIESRPSVAIALALRVKDPFYVEETVIRVAKTLEQSQESIDASRLQKCLDVLSDVELGKYML